MSTIRRVLFPVDFSLGCHALVPTVRRMVESWRAEITLLHVIETRQREGDRQELGSLMERMRTIAGGLRDRGVTCRVERGDPGERILEQIRTKGVDLVVMSAGGSACNPIGAVADQVLAEAPCSVWLDWVSTRYRSNAGMYAHQVGCALALNEYDEYVLSQAAEISGELEAGLTVIHAVRLPMRKPVVVLWDQRVVDRVLERAKRRIEGLLRRFHPAAKLAIEIGSNQAVVSRVIQDHGTGLLVTGNSREAILAARGECPVLRLAVAASAWAAVPEPEPRYAIAARRTA